MTDIKFVLYFNASAIKLQSPIISAQQTLGMKIPKKYNQTNNQKINN